MYRIFYVKILVSVFILLLLVIDISGNYLEKNSMKFIKSRTNENHTNYFTDIEKKPGLYIDKKNNNNNILENNFKNYAIIKNNYREWFKLLEHWFNKEITKFERIDANVFESRKHQKKKKKKKLYQIKKKYKKFLVPLLLAYKLKFFTLIPVLISALILLVGSAGIGGFFFALFAASMSAKGK